MFTIKANKSAVRVTPKEGEYLARALLFAALTGMGALIRIPLSPVPVTMQVFFVLLSGILLGPFWGPVSQLMYLVMGLCGAPFFAAPPHAGPAVLLGPTGGYLWGFVVASGLVGWIGNSLKVRRGAWKGRGIVVLLYANAAGIASIYILGTTWLGAWLAMRGRDAFLAYELGVKPFIMIDVLKGIAAAGLGARPLTRMWRRP